MRITFTTLCLLIFCSFSLKAQQDVIFEFANAQQTMGGGNTFYDVDVMVSTTTDFKMGSGLLYFDYNPLAFGNSVFANSRITITTATYILGQTAGFPIYEAPVINDNLTTRVAVSWQQGLSSACFANNVTGTVSGLFHLQLQYIPSGTGLDPGVCFTSAPPFDDQTFTACGPGGSCTFDDCLGSPGTQIILDAFDCSNSPLPLELLSFEVRKDKQSNALLQWNTVNEVNTSHFEIERSLDTKNWTYIGETQSAGFSANELRYNYLDTEVKNLSPFARDAYYRLRLVDRDGQYSYSEIRSIKLSGQQRISVYPNPTSNSVYIKLHSDEFKGRIELELINTSGQTVWSSIIDLQQKEEQYLRFGKKLSAGVYYLKGRDAFGNQFSERIVILQK